MEHANRLPWQIPIQDIFLVVRNERRLGLFYHREYPRHIGLICKLADYSSLSALQNKLIFVCRIGTRCKRTTMVITAPSLLLPVLEGLQVSSQGFLRPEKTQSGTSGSLIFHTVRIRPYRHNCRNWNIFQHMLVKLTDFISVGYFFIGQWHILLHTSKEIFYTVLHCVCYPLWPESKSGTPSRIRIRRKFQIREPQHS